MTTFVFNIPSNRSELLSELSTNYYVKDVVIQSEIISKLQEARQCLKEEGAYFILDNFDTYYSVLHHAKNLAPDVIFRAYEDLHKATKELNNLLGFLLEDKEDNVNDEVCDKMRNTLKMLLYIFTQFVIYLEQEKAKRQDQFLTKSKKQVSSKNDKFTIDKSKVIQSINNILQREINIFWDPPLVEHSFIEMYSELGFTLLQNPMITKEKEVRNEIFGMLGNLVKTYNFGDSFVMRLIQTVRFYEHFVQCAPEGVKLLIEQFNCKGLIHQFIKQATEWQNDEDMYQDNLGSKCCSKFLTDLAILIPDLMIPEVMYLNQYLKSESVPLRISVINVISEVIAKVLTNHELNDAEKESRDEFIETLLEHLNDTSALVRAKVIQNFSRLQKDMAIPLKFYEELLQEILRHLYDKAAAVRKSAIACLTTFIKHNPYGGNLQLKNNEEELQKMRDQLNRFEASYREARVAKIEELENIWNDIHEDLRNSIEDCLQNDEDDDDDKENEHPDKVPIDKELLVDLIRSQLKEKKFVDAFKMCQQLKESIEEWKDLKKLGDKNECELYVFVMRTLFMDTTKINDELRTGAGMTDEDIKRIQGLEKSIGFFEKMVIFLRLIDQAIEPMKKLLFTPTMTDMHEAIDFISTAHQFQIDNVNSAILAMLKIMQHNEPQRKEIIVEAFKEIYLVTNSNDMREHTTTILRRLISILKQLPCDHYEDFQIIVSEWTSKGILDNSVVDMCWQYYTGRVPVSDEDSRAVIELLRMAAIGRHTIVTKNVKVVSAIAFSDKGRNDMLFLANSCRLLAVAGRAKVDVDSKDPPFKIEITDPLFEDLTKIIVEKFFEDVAYYSKALEAAIDCIFRVCAKPFPVCENILKLIFEKCSQAKTNNLLYLRICDLLGFLAIQILGFLDDSLYKELKRRSNIREKRKEQKKTKKTNKNNARKSVAFEAVNESVLEGAVAEDTDAEFILGVLENDIVSGSGVLGKFTVFLKKICQNPEQFNNVHIQRSAINALMRFMLVSSKLCSDNIRLLFTIFERTTYPELKCMILLHCSDFLTRFPNIIEPWSPRIYERLKDPLVNVRITAFYTLSSLILRDMIRAHSHISEMAVCMIDENDEVRQICKTFFIRLSHKENNLSNVVPDIFTHLVKMDIAEDDFKTIMKFLFELIDKTKRMENLVDRFCVKFSAADADLKLNRSIAYCLSLINYNDKALQKLQEKFPSYRHHVHDPEIYASFKQIINEASKQKAGKVDLKPIATEIENLISSVFELDQDGNQMKPPPVPAKKILRRKKVAAKQNSDDEDFDSSNSSTISRRASKRTKAGKKKVVESSSDSE